MLGSTRSDAEASATALQIQAQTNALLVLSETGGTLTADGAEQTLYIDNAPLGVHKPRTVLIDLDNMAGGDTTELRVYYRLNAGGGLQLLDFNPYVGADGGLANSRVLVAIDLYETRFGVQVTLEQTAGVNRDY
ncbi:unnamed protein product, partial [marine sediment metagenome]